MNDANDAPKDDDTITAPGSAGTLYYTTWKELAYLWGNPMTLLALEGMHWIRGHASAQSPEWKALLVAWTLCQQ